MIVEIQTKYLNFKKFPGFVKEADRKFIKHFSNIGEARKTLAKAKLLGYKVLMYDEQYARSKDYRTKFKKAYGDGYTYRCVYCGKKLTSKTMQVDHVIPVNAAKTNKLTQKKLKGSVNDIDNLVPACPKCNKRKGASTLPAWRIKAELGQHEWYWTLLSVMKVIVAVLAITLVFGLITMHFGSKVLPEIKSIADDVLTMEEAISNNLTK